LTTPEPVDRRVEQLDYTSDLRALGPTAETTSDHSTVLHTYSVTLPLLFSSDTGHLTFSNAADVFFLISFFERLISEVARSIITKFLNQFEGDQN